MTAKVLWQFLLRVSLRCWFWRQFDLGELGRYSNVGWCDAVPLSMKGRTYSIGMARYAEDRLDIVFYPNKWSVILFPCLSHGYGGVCGGWHCWRWRKVSCVVRQRRYWACTELRARLGSVKKCYGSKVWHAASACQLSIAVRGRKIVWAIAEHVETVRNWCDFGMANPKRERRRC